MSTPRLAILASETSWYFRQLQSAAERKGWHVTRLGFPDLAAELCFPTDRRTLTAARQTLSASAENGTPKIALASPPANAVTTSPGLRRTAANSMELSREPLADWTPDHDWVVVRTMPIGSLEQVIFRMDVLRWWENRGIEVINPPICLETSIDKFLTLEAFQRCEIPFPETFACQTAEQAWDAFERLGQDIVVKPIFGGEGRGIVRVREPEMAHRVFTTLENCRSVIYCQRFVRPIRQDIRILLLGDKSFSVSRSNPDSWLSNAAQGGRAEKYEPSAEVLELARRAANSVGGLIVGVDLVQDQDERWMVLEVNAVPGWQSLQQATGVCIADEIVTLLGNRGLK